MKNILIISGHPNLENSVANHVILDELTRALPNADIRRLDALYPNYQINVAAEQTALEWADVIVWQFPFYWYSMPALMKKWLDDVFVHGFAHGSTAKLGGKQLLVSLTTGAPKGAYGKEAFMRHDVEDYFASLESTAMLCNLEFVPPMYLNGVSYTGRNPAEVEKQQADSKAYAQQLIAKIESL